MNQTLIVDLAQFFLSRYPSSFIESQFRKFFTQFLQLSPFVFIPKNSSEFINIRTQLIDRPTHRQSQIARIINDAHTHDTAIDLPTIPPNISKTNTSNTEPKYDDKVTIHYTHEKRLASMKRDIHQTYDQLFKNTPAQTTRLIIGNRNRRDARNELIRKRPRRSLLRNSDHQSSSQICFSIQTYLFILSAFFLFL